jgi:hypothetical protein
VSPITRPDLAADPAINPRAMGIILWGAEAGQKMDDFAALGTGSGGWYYSKARGDHIIPDQPAVYQPPKIGSGYNFEFDGDALPDYAAFCLDCHTHRVSEANPPVNWGQGIDCTDNSVDPPNQRIECGAQHGLLPANKPYAWDPASTFYGNSGNPDPIFNQPNVQRGRGAGQFMRWPYESADRNAGINFVMSCTDCHEAHGSTVGAMLRTTVNNGPGSGIWNTMCNNCHYYYGYQHAGMSCGNASCHEANSIHRIIHVTHSPDSYLWEEPSRPITTPEIENIIGAINSDELLVIFKEGVYTNMDQTGALEPGDFLLTDVNENNPRTITNIIHTPGDFNATIIMSAPLSGADIGVDLLATRGVSIWDSDGEPAGPWPVNIPLCPRDANFQLNEPAGSTTARDESGRLIGAVNDPNETFSGDGYFHGDGVDNYIDFENNNRCLQADRKMTIELRIKPTGIGTANYIKRVLARDSGGNYQASVWRNTNWVNYNPRDSVASIALWVKPVDAHGGNVWKPVLTDYDNYPIVSDHWYLVKIVWDSDKSVGNIPCDIFVDDQGTDGLGSGENWAGYPNATKSDQSYLTPEQFLQSGDEINTNDGAFSIGCNVNNHANNVFLGLIDWITWEDVVNY